MQKCFYSFTKKQSGLGILAFPLCFEIGLIIHNFTLAEFVHDFKLELDKKNPNTEIAISILLRF